MADNVQEQLKVMGKEINNLKHEVERLQAVHEIQNLASKYCHIHLPTTMQKSYELFALKQPDVSVEIAMWGKYIGADKVRRMYGGPGDEERKPPMPEGEERKLNLGGFAEHQLTTPIIQVAADGKTAKGIWFSPGHETYAGETNPEPGGELVAHWCWGKWGADFIKEDGQWKIWHYHWYDTFMCPYNKSWVETPQPPLGITMEQPGQKPDSPPTSRSTYFPDQVRPAIPACPEPYETWDGKSVA
jgi:hypothetical protein